VAHDAVVADTMAALAAFLKDAALPDSLEGDAGA
jgi:hypothetical protein